MINVTYGIAYRCVGIEYGVISHYALPAVIVNPVTETVKPTLIAAVFNINSVPLVPAVPSITQTPALVVILNHVALPTNNPVVLAGKVGDNTDAAEAAENGVPSVNSANLLVAAPPAAG
jgi:hypothetical protein